MTVDSKTVDLELFCKTWTNSATLSDVSRTMGLSEEECVVIASKLRTADVKFHDHKLVVCLMTRPVPRGIVVVGSVQYQGEEGDDCGELAIIMDDVGGAEKRIVVRRPLPSTDNERKASAIVSMLDRAHFLSVDDADERRSAVKVIAEIIAAPAPPPKVYKR